MNPGLAAYRSLLARLDSFQEGVRGRFPGSFTCRRGCDGCCRHLTLFAVEGENLRLAAGSLSPAEKEDLAARSRAALAEPSASSSPCPLLVSGACLLYGARPVICRTQGLPLLVRQGEEASVDFCPRNFQGVGSFPGEAVLDLERVNAALSAADGLFQSEAGVSGEGRKPLASWLELG